MNARVGILLFALPGMLAAQAVVESAMGVGRAATSTVPAQKAGQAIGRAFDGLGRTLEPAGARSTAVKPAARSVRTAPARPQRPAPTKAQPKVTSVSVFPPPEHPVLVLQPKPEVTLEDPAGIEKGMEYAEIVRRFGPPSLTLTTGPGEETLCYAKKKASVDVTMHNGKVASVQRAGG